MKKTVILLMFAAFAFSSCDVVQQVAGNLVTGTILPPSKEEIGSGLKEALNIGTNKAIESLSVQNGFKNDALAAIPFPQEIKQVEVKLRALGLDPIIDNFVSEMNRGASEAVKKAGPIFASAVTSMTFDDAYHILTGADNAATQYFDKACRANLAKAFSPEVKKVLDVYGISASYTKLIQSYNAIPMVTKVNPDLNNYVTNKAIDGLMLKIQQQEKTIRTSTAARSTALMQKVFGYADHQKIFKVK